MSENWELVLAKAPVSLSLHPHQSFLRFTLKKHKSEKHKSKARAQNKVLLSNRLVEDSVWNPLTAIVKGSFITGESTVRHSPAWIGELNTWNKLGWSWSFDGSMHYGHTEDSAGTFFILRSWSSSISPHWKLTALRRHHHVDTAAPHRLRCRDRRKEFSKLKNWLFFTENFLPFSAGKDGVCCYSPDRAEFSKWKSRLTLYDLFYFIT